MVQNNENLDNMVTHRDSLKEHDTSTPWTEVVRRGNRNKTRSRNDIISSHNMCVLEY
jgi:hypothetical protein